MFDRIWQYAAAFGAAMMAVLYALVHWRTYQRDKQEARAERAEREAKTAQTVNKQRGKADAASQAAKEKGDKDVENAVGLSRTRRDYFEHSLRDKDD